MRRKFLNWFAVLLLLVLAVWVSGVVAGAGVPLFGGIRTEPIAAIAFGVAAVAETISVVTECLVEWASRRKPEHRTGLLGPKRYGNKKHALLYSKVRPDGRN